MNFFGFSINKAFSCELKKNGSQLCFIVHFKILHKYNKFSPHPPPPPPPHPPPPPPPPSYFILQSVYWESRFGPQLSGYITFTPTGARANTYFIIGGIKTLGGGRLDPESFIYEHGN